MLDILALSRLTAEQAQAVRHLEQWARFDERARRTCAPLWFFSGFMVGLLVAWGAS